MIPPFSSISRGEAEVPLEILQKQPGEHPALLFDDGRILFLNRGDMEDAEGIRLRLHSPVKRGPCLVVEKGWELGGVRGSSIVRVEDEFRLYYEVTLPDGRHCMAFAVSRDGIQWERPELGAVEFNGNSRNNLVDVQSHPFNESCVFLDPVAPDESRFKLVAHSPSQGGMFLFTSPDGVRFTRQPGHLLRFILDNHMTAFYDERARRYRIYTRGWDKSRGIPPMPGTRCVVLAETDDLSKPVPFDENAPDPWEPQPKWLNTEWSGIRRLNRELPIVLRCDENDPEQGGLYQAAVVHYLPEVYLAFPSFYFTYPWPPEGQFINDGLLDIQFASSRDGMCWNRDLRDPYVRLDLPDGPASKMMHMLAGMVPGGGCVQQYYVGGRRSHGEGRTDKDVRVVHETHHGDPIALRLEQRMDGFVFAESSYTGGRLVTRPFRLQSPELCLNIDTSASGVARAALLREDGTPVEGYGLKKCGRIHGNSIRMPVRWNGRADLSNLAGQTVRLLLESRAARLFAVYP